MRKSIRFLLLGASAVIALSSQAMAATELNITCRCVIGGVNSGTAVHLKVRPPWFHRFAMRVMFGWVWMDAL